MGLNRTLRAGEGLQFQAWNGDVIRIDLYYKQGYEGLQAHIAAPPHIKISRYPCPRKLHKGRPVGEPRGGRR